MPPDHRTFIRQRVVHIPDDKIYKENLRYLAHIRYEIFEMIILII